MAGMTASDSSGGLINNAGIPKNSWQMACLQLEVYLLREKIVFSNRK